MNWDEISEQLKKPLNASAIKPPAPGKFGEYVDGKHIIDEANRIFGHNGWSYVVTRLEKCSELTIANNGADQFRVGYICSVRVMVDGVTREGVAGGSGVGKVENTADHHQSAVKEAETDALKRALRTFGNTFGLALYEKDKDKREVTPDMTPLEGNLSNAIRGVTAMQNLTHLLASPKFKADLERLRKTDPEAAARVDVVSDQRKHDFEGNI